MFPLLALSILAMALILERIFFWIQLTRRQDKVIREALALYRRSAKAAFQFLERNADLPLPRIFLAALELEQANPEEFRIALESAAQAELPLLKRFTIVFDTVTSVAPLLGLLGTILGLIQSFSSLELGNLGGTQTTGVTAGISEALISTASGLMVAIFTLLFANMFRGLYQRQVALIQEYGGQIELLYRRRYEQSRGFPPYAPS
ncbi:MAG: MotA/TolQ/ExbB proton channel family protein [Oculatellaceae cyanobacterium bins.114]|nr:MotA/TolQ/ExbB proton channel family protein [Oculatellaceae cyanobacterium bins.114]